MSSDQTLFEEECFRCAKGSQAYKEAFCTSENALMLLSQSTKILDINPAMAEICQFSRHQLQDQSFETLFPKTSDYHNLLSQRTLSAHRPLFIFATVMKPRHKEYIPVSIAVSPVTGDRTEPAIFQAHISPHETLHGMNGAQGSSLTVFHGPRMAVARSGLWPMGTYMETDPVMTQLLGYTPKELGAMNILDLIEDVEKKTALAEAVGKDKTVKEPALVLRHKEGHAVQVSYAARPVIQSETGKPAIDEVLIEAPATGQTEAACRTADRLRSIGALAGGIAHNFNNILTGIYGNLTLARMELDGHPNTRHHLEKAENSMEEMVKLTRQLLTFAKGGDPVKQTFDPAPMLKESVTFNLSGAKLKPVINIREGLWQIHGDRDQISQVLTNIVINARQATTRGGTLTVEAENTTLLKDNLLTIARGAYVKICLKDNGTGIAQHDLDRIFDPYFTTRPDGSGMGLAICYSIITKHKGHISVTSQLGSGTAVTLYLPAVPDNPPKEETMISQPSKSPQQASILVMDDEEHIRTITRKMLEKFGHTVTMAEDGEQAVDAYAKAMEAGTPFHVVIMDLTIPGGMGGKEASRIILDMDPEASIVVSSGYSNDKIMSDYKAYGLKGIIPKPFRLADLKTTVENLISQ